MGRDSDWGGLFESSNSDLVRLRDLGGALVLAIRQPSHGRPSRPGSHGGDERLKSQTVRCLNPARVARPLGPLDPLGGRK